MLSQQFFKPLRTKELLHTMCSVYVLGVRVLVLLILVMFSQHLVRYRAEGAFTDEGGFVSAAVMV